MFKLGIIGLGKMGFNIALKAKESKYKLLVHDINYKMKFKAEKEKMIFFNDLESLVSNFKDQRKVILLSLPSGAPTNNTIKKLIKLLNTKDIILDAGNSFYKDTLNNYKIVKQRNIEFVDVGISGGIEGARNGACLMVGGEEKVIEYLKNLFLNLATNNGFLHTGEVGSGHFAKMIHNGIEYGMMQAIGEGFEIIKKSSFNYDLEKLAKVWNNGSIIESALMGFAQSLFSKDNNLSKIPNNIKSSGEGLWTVQTALEMGISTPVINSSLLNRFKSCNDKNFGDKVVSGLRKEFGGHKLK